ncbi:unnamed protein product [Cunninghamella blakesleeana]
MSIYGLFTLASTLQLALAAQFKVIAPGGNQVQVLTGGKTFDLKAPDADVPYFVGEANSDGTYKYVVNGKPESFDRKLQGSSTKNDFYERPVTYANIPKLPNVFNSGNWDRAVESGPIFDTNYITSVFINGKQNEMEDLIVNLQNVTYTTKITFIDANEVHTFNKGKLQLHKPWKKHNNQKQSWKWELPSGSSINGRTFFKIRHMEEDPTQIREKLYADILQAMGTYANRANMIRFFINGEAMGTFNMLDDIPDYSYVRALFNHGNQLPANKGPLYDGASGASFEDTTDNYDAFLPAPGSPSDKTFLKKICKDFATLNPTSDADVAKFNNEFDVDQFLRFMVMEYLAGHWDGYWQEQTNIGAYVENNSKLYFLPQDFDATNGVNIAEGREFVTWSYKEYPKKFPKGILINKLLQNNGIKNRFETYIKQTVSTVYNNNTLTQRVLAYHDFILPDLKWDRSIKQRAKRGINFGWKFEQCTENLWHGVSAPNNNGGGADWGLLEWINARSKAVAKEFGL